MKPVKKEFAQTKKLFFNDTFDRFSVSRKTESDACPKAGGRTAQERQWRKEYIASWASQLAVDDLTAVEKLVEVVAAEALSELILMAENGDSYAKLRYANAIWEIANNGIASEEIRAEGRATALQIWRSLVKDPVVLTKEHRTKLAPIWGLFNSMTAEEQVLNDAKCHLTMVEEQKKSKTKPHPAQKVSRRHIAAAAIVNFEDGGAGCIEEKEVSATDSQTYKFMPFRSLSHHNLGLELKKRGVARVEIEMEDKIVQALVTAMDSRHITLSVLPE
jgi:hypothetical protein